MLQGLKQNHVENIIVAVGCRTYISTFVESKPSVFGCAKTHSPTS